MKISEELKMLDKLPNNSEKASCFWGIVKQETDICDTFLDTQERDTFRQYHSNFRNIDKNRLRYEKDAHARVVQHLVNSIKLDIKVLDAGCGTGSDSILCGILGADVVGVDLSEERLTVANKRAKFYHSNLDRPLNCRFYAQSVFDLPDNDNYDIICSRQSISHIEPADKFIELAYLHLKEGGKLIVNDSNDLNPYVYIQTKIAQRREGGTYTTTKNPRTGEDVPYARERMFTALSIKNLLIKKGFSVEILAVQGFCPYISPLNYRSKNFSYYFNNIFKRVPIIRLFGGTYTVVGRKT